MLVWVPCFFLWIFLPLDLYYLSRSTKPDIRWTWINRLKLVITAALSVTSIADIALAFTEKDTTKVPNVDLYSPLIKLLTFVSKCINDDCEKK